MTEQTRTHALDFAKQNHEEALELLRALAIIPAPSHHEERRALFIRDWMLKNGMQKAYIDEATNVICPLGDDGRKDLLVFAAHTDIVFDDTSELPLREEGGLMYAPGVGDDTANLVAMLMAGRHLAQNPELLPDGYGVLIVANSCEEGLGNLKGTKQLFATYGPRIKRYYSFDLYIPGVVSTAVGAHRWRITVRTKGGHSYGDFGNANAIERLCAIVGELYQLKLPEDISATFNVGTIEGGTTVNAIASEAHALFEYRSTSDAVLKNLREQMNSILACFQSSEVSVTTEKVGIRPASSVKRSEELERMTRLTHSVLHGITGQPAVDIPV